MLDKSTIFISEIKKRIGYEQATEKTACGHTDI
jgi:hypothetical protein